MTKDEALELALHALHTKGEHHPRVYESIYAIQTVLAQPEQQAEPCIGKDPRCPCQDGDACHYKDCGGTKAWPVQRPWVGLTKQDMPSGENPMFDHEYFIGGMVYAAKVLQAKNT